jgi:sugar phosphate isomerase/epimerase
MYTRRHFTRLALAALPAARVLGSPALAFQARPNSKVRGVTIGMNVPYNFGGRTAPVDEIIDKCVQLGVSGLELRTQPVEAFLGLPDALVTAAAAPAGGRNAKPSTPEQDAARKTANDEIRKWRLAAPMDKAQALRKKFDDAGILVEIVKVDNILSMADEVIDYEFRLAKALGARAISTEITHIDPKAPPTGPLPEKRLGAFADKHKLMVGYHGHAETGPKEWKEVFSYAQHNGANLDIGHFIVGNKTSPVPFLKENHARITHIHVKDRKLDGSNVPFGTGDTPIKEVLTLIRDNKWPIQATIEFEYPVPAGSDRMTELKKCVDYCRGVLA